MLPKPHRHFDRSRAVSSRGGVEKSPHSVFVFCFSPVTKSRFAVSGVPLRSLCCRRCKQLRARELYARRPSRLTFTPIFHRWLNLPLSTSYVILFPVERSRSGCGTRILCPAEEVLAALATIDRVNRIAFGLFEVDLQAGELWKSGFKVRLSGQPFKVLTTLLANPGEVVTRDELQLQVWGSNTNVDFERALASAVNKVREALGDSADNPRFIETLTKRGYRFIAPVHVLSKPAMLDLSPLPASEMRIEVPLLETETNASQLSPRPFPTGQPPALDGNAVRPAARMLIRPYVLLSLIGLLFLLELVSFLMRGRAQPSPPRLEQLTFDSPISPGPPNPESLPSLIVEGNRLITSVLVDGKPQLARVSASTGGLEQIMLPRELVSTVPADISKDGTRLLVLSRLSTSSEQPLWVVPTDGGSALRVGEIVAHDATWMPAGNDIMYASGNDLWTVPAAGGRTVLFATLAGRAYWLRWSPDGKMLRFTLIDPVQHTFSLWEFKKGDRAPHRMTGLGADPPSVCCGVWTADGSAYIFQEARPGITDLWELRGGFFGSTLRQLTNGPLRYFSPVAARTGHRIYFLGSDTPLGLQRFDAARQEFATASVFLRNAIRVSFSRDGQWVAWTDGAGQLWRAHAVDGSEKLQLTPPNLEVFSAYWSPDNRRLALMARMPGQMWQIYMIDAAGGELKQVLRDPRNTADPTWSPDGRFLAFGREPDLMGKESGTHTIELLDVQTGNTTSTPDSDGLFSPRWSPDGRWIAALSLDQKRIRLLDLQKNKWQDLAVTSAADPVWSSDSKALFVHAFLADEQPILRIQVPAGDIHRLADLTELHLKEPANYFFSGLDPNNQPLVLPRVGTSNLYTLDLE